MLHRPSVRQEDGSEAQVPLSNEPALCPWREPERDMKALFPGSTDYRTELFTLSQYRIEILRRLGPRSRIESHSLHVFRVFNGTNAVGAVMVRRFSAPHGAMEVVIGCDPDGRIAGVRIQRQREPVEIAGPITSPSWLATFVGKTADSPLQLGKDIAEVPPSARETATSLVAAVRARLIEFAVGAKKTGVANH
jgi:hypothetical protein